MKSMKLESGKITMLVSEEETTIEIRDYKAATMFCRIKLTPTQLSQMLSRLSQTECEVEVFGLNKIGKSHENRRFEFEIPKNMRSSSHSNELTDLCKEALSRQGMPEWVPDNYFGSRDTFREIGDKTYATAIIRRWV